MLRIFLTLALLLPLFARAESLPAEIRFAEVGVPGTQKAYSTGLVQIAVAQGFFDQEFGPGGPKITVTYFTGTGPAINEALSQGEVDFGNYGGLPAVIGKAGHVPAHIVLVRHASNGTIMNQFAVHQNSPYHSVADFKGSRVAVQIGTNPYMALEEILAANNLSDHDVKIVNLMGPDAVAAFNAGGADALFSGTSTLLLRDRGLVRLVEAPVPQILKRVSISGYLLSDKFAGSYPDTAARVVKVLVKAAYWASQDQNRQAVLNYIAQAGYGLQVAQEQYPGPLKASFSPLIDNSSKQGFNEIAQFAAAHKMTRNVPALDDWYAPQYLDKALKDLNLQNFWQENAS